MGKRSSGSWLQGKGATARWLLCSVFVFALALGQASATVISDTFLGFPPNPFTQQDKTYGAWSGNLPVNFTTLISTRSGIVPGEDLHTVSFGATFLPNSTYTVSYYIMVNTASVAITEASNGVRDTITGASITTTFTEIPAFNITTTTASGLSPLPAGPYTMLHVTDTITTGGSDITGFSNSFIERVPKGPIVPEPGTLAMFGSGVLGLGAVLRRKFL